MSVETYIDFKRGYIRALFLENERLINCIRKYWMIMPGEPKNPRHIKRDLALKEKLADQVHPDTYEDRKAYLRAWVFWFLTFLFFGKFESFG